MQGLLEDCKDTRKSGVSGGSVENALALVRYVASRYASSSSDMHPHPPVCILILRYASSSSLLRYASSSSLLNPPCLSLSTLRLSFSFSLSLSGRWGKRITGGGFAYPAHCLLVTCSKVSVRNEGRLLTVQLIR